MLRTIGRAVDWTLSRGPGLDAAADPFGAPLAPQEAEALLAAIRRAPPAPTPFVSPLPPPGGSANVEVRLVGEGPRWALVAPHYGSLVHPRRLGVTGALVRALRGEGYAVALIALPYHASRAVEGHESGWGFVRADLAATARAVASSAAETMALARRLRETHGAERLVGIGVSLGGVAVGLSAACGAPFDAAGFLAAVDNPASFYATGQNRAARRATLAAHGFGARETAAAFAPVAPSTHAPPLPSARLVFAIPSEDAIVPPATQEAWRGAWRGRALALRGHGHGTAIASPAVAARLVAALAA